MECRSQVVVPFFLRHVIRMKSFLFLHATVTVYVRI